MGIDHKYTVLPYREIKLVTRMSLVHTVLRIGHDNFELVNHDIVNPLMIEGKNVSCS